MPVSGIQLLKVNAIAVGEFIKRSVIMELKEQGHIIDVITPGYPETFEDSLEIKIVNISRGISIQLWGNDYALDMDTGTSAADVNYDPLQMIDWARIIKPDYGREELESYVKRLHRRHQKVGTPTAESYNYSKNGRRTGFIQAGIIDKSEELEQWLGLFSVVDSALQSMVIEVNKVIL